MKMTSTVPFWTAVAAVVSGFAGPASAQQGATPMSETTAPLSQVQGWENVGGKEVYSSDHQKIGKLDVLVGDLESGRILYGVVDSSKGKVAVPPQIFTQVTGKTIQANVSWDKLEGAPQFSASSADLAEMGNSQFVNQIYQHFGLQSWLQGNQGATAATFKGVQRVGKMRGMKVENAQNQTLGKVDDVVVDLPAGHMLFVVLAPDSSLKLGGNLYPVPPTQFTLSSDQKHLMANLDPEKLAAAPHFDKNAWPNLSDASYALQVYQYYGKQPYFNAAGAMQPTGRVKGP
jgi:sporulation protein YlmC with PRC-barrel domain